MYSRIIKYPENKSFFLFGPRGTGKTTWVKSNFPSAVYLDLLEAEIYNDLMANPQRLEKFIPEDFKDWIIIDEIQRVPEILNEVHRLIEGKKYKFILTGSSARKIRRKGFNLLAGRALTYSMFPLTAKESGTDFQIEKRVKHGCLPAVFSEDNPAAYLESYVKTYLDEEVKQEGLTRNMGNFYRFLETASFSQGAVLNVSNIAKESSVERKVVENYFSILGDLLISYKLPVFAKKAKRRLISHPKFYFFDPGVYRVIRPKGPFDKPEEIEGIALESLFCQQIIALNSYLNAGYKIYYWRTSNGTEVDFVIYGEKGIKAFEIKKTSRLSSKDFSGLKAFLSDYPQTKVFLGYGGERKMNERGITVLPLNDLFKNLPEIISE